MKISQETSKILKKFSTINQGILFRKGNLISTISPQNNIRAEAVVPEYFPQDFGIFDLDNFLSVTSLFKDGYELEFDDKHVIVVGMGGRTKIKYRFTDESMIVAAPEKKPKLPNVDVKFTISQDDLNWVMKTANVLGSPNVSVESDGTTIKLVTFDISDNSAHTQALELTDSEINTDDPTFKLIFKTENLKLLPDTYFVEISARGLSTWTSTTQEIKYWIALEMQSKFGN